MSIFPVYRPFPYNIFVYSLEGKIHKKDKLEIMTNVGESHHFQTFPE